ncbi:hypothetical protein [Marinilactibacillus kalidii]|uniref:hypothetical protein n=1 Tax=Marinilactibacillus kalidii TaxID=2820274 RepID=UPI001ABDA4A5|nr:hypothetical protein [Marinilactibacillus kalidii]
MNSLIDFLTKHIRFILNALMILIIVFGAWAMIDGLINRFYSTLVLFFVIVYGSRLKRYLLKARNKRKMHT